MTTFMTSDDLFVCERPLMHAETDVECPKCGIRWCIICLPGSARLEAGCYGIATVCCTPRQASAGTRRLREAKQ